VPDRTYCKISGKVCGPHKTEVRIIRNKGQRPTSGGRAGAPPKPFIAHPPEFLLAKVEIAPSLGGDPLTAIASNHLSGNGARTRRRKRLESGQAKQVEMDA
jgi:hypothetical protein